MEIQVGDVFEHRDLYDRASFWLVQRLTKAAGIPHAVLHEIGNSTRLKTLSVVALRENHSYVLKKAPTRAATGAALEIYAARLPEVSASRINS